MGHRINKFILGRLSKHRCKGEIPRSGKEALEVNCFVVYLKDNDDWALIVHDVNEHGYIGDYWDGSSFSTPAIIPYSLNRKISLEINHFYKQYNFQYGSIYRYIIEGLTGIDKVRAFLDKTKQFWFNRKTLVLSERIDILKILVRETIGNENFEITAISLPNFLHGYRYILHPDKKRQQRYAKLLLESLVKSGEVETGKYGYKITGKALETISKYESSERKHEETFNQSKAIKWLTVALIIVGLIQAASTYYSTR